MRHPSWPHPILNPEWEALTNSERGTVWVVSLACVAAGNPWAGSLPRPRSPACFPPLPFPSLVRPHPSSLPRKSAQRAPRSSQWLRGGLTHCPVTAGFVCHCALGCSHHLLIRQSPCPTCRSIHWSLGRWTPAGEGGGCAGLLRSHEFVGWAEKHQGSLSLWWCAEKRGVPVTSQTLSLCFFLFGQRPLSGGSNGWRRRNIVS